MEPEDRDMLDAELCPELRFSPRKSVGIAQHKGRYDAVISYYAALKGV
jgi:hypothetical protein